MENNKTNKKISSIEWLIEQLTINPISNITDEQWFGIMGQAKAMHKEEAALSWIEACEAIIFSIENNETNTFSSQKQFEKYYKKTYGND